MNAFLKPLLCSAALLAGCAAQETADAPWPQADTHCSSATVLLDAHFETGNLGRCTVEADGSFTLSLFPENAPPINPSAWYAFRATGKPGDRIDVRLELGHGYARYWPKFSADGVNWTPLPAEAVTGGGEASKSMTFQFELEGSQSWVAGQEIIDTADYRAWFETMEAAGGVDSRLLGSSVQGRPIRIAETGDRTEFILMIGRQHPPEITGAIGMQAFLETVFSGTDQARRFRDRYKLGVVPLMNPDGVANGHWRNNVNATDLNRDWGPFLQPETQAVMRWVGEQESAGRRLVLMLDFHSTWEDLFYLPPAEAGVSAFTDAWLDASGARMPEIPFRRVPSTSLDQPNSKNYFFKSRGIPAVTYEVGDDTDRETIRKAAVVFAEEMMRLMLERPF